MQSTFNLFMDTPLRDVLNMLVGRLRVNEPKLQDWLNRGRKPLAELDEEFRRHGPPVPEHPFATTDTTPDAVRAAAYRVEARRSLLRALDDFLILLLLSAVAGAGAITVALVVWWGLDVWWGIGVAVGTVALVAWVRRRGVEQATEAVPWRQGLEPLVWALYYPTQLAQQVLEAKEELRRAPDKTIRKTVEEMDAEIERGPDGVALPGQDKKIAALMAFMAIGFRSTP